MSATATERAGPMPVFPAAGPGLDALSTLLTEALLHGYQGVGADVSDQAVAATEKNLAWTTAQFTIPNAHSKTLVSDVRGRGFLMGIEVVSPAVATAIRDACLARGLIIELGGRHDCVLRLLPPLVLTEEQASIIVDILAEAVATVSAVAA